MDNTYLFHQTPSKLANDLLSFVPLVENDIVLEPFSGEDAFYNAFPDFVQKEWCEIERGRDWKSYEDKVDWVISNPPFRLETEGKRENAFFKILHHFSKRVKKGIAFLGNDYCLSTLTPRRMQMLNEEGIFLHKVVVCSVKKWRGRYFFMIFKREPSPAFSYLPSSY
jgi:hypothetical protein